MVQPLRMGATPGAPTEPEIVGKKGKKPEEEK
jgi:hypothetical protein